MAYSDYTIEQINREGKNYQDICNLFFSLTNDSNVKNKLEDILYKGGYKDYGLFSRISNRDNPYIEMQRRISMAYLLVRNPETFDVLVDGQINLFHGTNANALPSILKYGVNCVDESIKKGIYVSTGEKSTRANGRNFVSFTDVLDVAIEYSSLKPENGKENLSFEVIIGTTVNDVINSGHCVVPSEIPEVGVKNSLPLERIRVICVPQDKVEFVKRLVDDEIKVVAMDDLSERFYYIDELGNINVEEELLNKLKSDLVNQKKSKRFSLEEIRGLLQKRRLTPIMGKLEDITASLNEGKKSNYDR